MSAMTRAVRRLRRDDDGLTLPEMLVAMTLLAIVMSIVVSFVSTISRSFTRDSAASESTNIAANGVNELTRVIRSGTQLRLTGGGTVDAPVFVNAATNGMTLYAYIDTDSVTPAPTRVAFTIDAQRRLVETRWDATTTSAPWAFAASPSYTKIIAGKIPAGATPLFTYFLADGNELLVPTVGTFSTAQLKTIAAVRVQLTVQADVTDRAAPVSIRNTVSIPNLGISRVGPSS